MPRVLDFDDAFTSSTNPTILGTRDRQTINNNQSSAEDITALSFDSSSVTSAIIDYEIRRTTDSVSLVEVGRFVVFFESSAWSLELGDGYNEIANVTLTITTGGQVQYTSSNESGTGYSGEIKFEVRSQPL